MLRVRITVRTNKRQGLIYCLAVKLQADARGSELVDGVRISVKIKR